MLVQSIEIKSEEKKKSIMGLAILGKELFVLCEMSSEVEVYDSMKLSFSRRWNLEDTIQPQDIVSCNKNNCMYIFDNRGSLKSNAILRVDTNGTLIKKWATGNHFGYSLSVTDEANIILPVYNARALNEYSPDGQLIRKLYILPGLDLGEIWHAIKLPNGHFVVSLRSANLFPAHILVLHHVYRDNLHRVCIVDGDGRLKKAFGGKFTSTIGHMNVPFHMFIDGNGFVLVVDRENGRVLLLNSDLEFKREILSKEDKHGLQRPTRIHMDESKSRLYVADNESNNERILIFEF